MNVLDRFFVKLETYRSEKFKSNNIFSFHEEKCEKMKCEVLYCLRCVWGKGCEYRCVCGCVWVCFLFEWVWRGVCGLHNRFKLKTSTDASSIFKYWENSKNGRRTRGRRVDFKEGWNYAGSEPNIQFKIPLFSSIFHDGEWLNTR